MVYMAGDNGRVFDTKYGKLQLMASMAEPGYNDLLEMGGIGTTQNVAVTCLFDTASGSYTIEVRRGRGFADSVVSLMPSINTGDPANLRDFIVRSIGAYPARRYALIIWNHGTGWLDIDPYAAVRSPVLGAKHMTIFRSTPARLSAGAKTRPIAFDDSCQDFLDSADLRCALEQARQMSGVRLSMIGMDACLMAMVEGARELAPFAEVLVASQEVEPMSGWPYASILGALDGTPEMKPSELALSVVGAYAANYGGRVRALESTVTQSAIALARTDVTEALCRGLVESVVESPAGVLAEYLRTARAGTLQFQDRNYADLGDFAAQLAAVTERTGFPKVTAAAAALRDHLLGRGDDKPVLRVGFLPAYERACGLSVFLPPIMPPAQRYQLLEIYRRLKFAQATGWDRLIGCMQSN